MTERQLFDAFERIHPKHRMLESPPPHGKTSWRVIRTVPESTGQFVVVGRFELGEDANALAEFFVAAMAFARERYAGADFRMRVQEALGIQVRGFLTDDELIAKIVALTEALEAT